MLISSYNPRELGDTLIVIANKDTETQSTQQKNDIVRIFDEETDQTLGYNFLAISTILPELTGNGQVFLTTTEISKLNKSLERTGFDADLMPDLEPKFVVGHVDKMAPHPDSDHLNVTQTTVDHGQQLQIVSGSPNMKTDIKVVVAKVGAMMPDGLIVWPGQLRGVSSNGMICSGRELQISGAPDVPGAMILPDTYQVGASFDRNDERAKHIFD